MYVNSGWDIGVYQKVPLSQKLRGLLQNLDISAPLCKLIQQPEVGHHDQ